MARTLRPELMDQAPAADVAANLRDLARINRWLGGNWILARLLEPYLRANPASRILDAGAADGATLQWLSKRFPHARMTALDSAERLLRRGGGERVVADVSNWPIAPNSVDIVICSLFLHHFPDDAVRRILANFEDAARVAVIAVDLHRHRLAGAFLPITRPFARWHPLTVHDGVISVNAAFTPAEMRNLAPRARVRTHWPWFRLSLEIPVSPLQGSR
ncbi:MAG: methyltransferase domain-containing protein [Acidobacteria bacterium]|nr:methyltransferase domain-containing protein [Acidobacteriota bacterium]